MSAVTQTATRSEKDSIGPKEIPAHVYYGIQTARAVENYPISGMRAHPTLIRALGMVKEAAAEANRDGCPISQALKGNVALSVEATLEE